MGNNLTWRDLIYLSEFRKKDACSRELVQRDIRAMLLKILEHMGGGENLDNWLPSRLYVMSKRLEQLQKG